jgi:histone acetyltransferase (RNA polymerase elongator complex component)
VPHAGCPNCCVFCSQEKITGEKKEKDIETEISELRNLLESENGNFEESQIAFFGGSFTAIERNRMEKLLSVANEYIEKGVAQSIRISTRPDKIDSEILAVLKGYKVSNIELGVQSTDDKVLLSCERGHTAKSSFASAKLITENGFVFGGQMMIGLPGSNIESEVKTAKDIVAMGAREARIYPTVVFENTKLYKMAQNGDYKPLSVEEAVERTAKCYKIFLDAGIKVLRVGLHSSENLKNAPLGANHPALGELVKSQVYVDMIAETVGVIENKILSVGVMKEHISMLKGHNGFAIRKLKELTKASEIEICPIETEPFKPLIKIKLP